MGINATLSHFFGIKQHFLKICGFLFVTATEVVFEREFYYPKQFFI